jgi:hypothetical protein
MKALTAALTLAIMLGGHMAALGNNTSEDDKKLKKQEQREILSSELDKLFKEGRLAETVVKPIYNSTDQLINTEILKISNKDNSKKS